MLWSAFVPSTRLVDDQIRLAQAKYRIPPGGVIRPGTCDATDSKGRVQSKERHAEMDGSTRQACECSYIPLWTHCNCGETPIKSEQPFLGGNLAI